jgi:hypothetical protein
MFGFISAFWTYHLKVKWLPYFLMELDEKWVTTQIFYDLKNQFVRNLKDHGKYLTLILSNIGFHISILTSQNIRI